MSNSFFVIPKSGATVVADTTTAGTAASNLVNDYIGTVWKSTGTATAFLTIDFGVAVGIDFVSLLSCVANSAVTQRIRAAATAGNVTAAPAYDSGVVAAFVGNAVSVSNRSNTYHEIATVQTYRYWRIDLASLSGSTFESARLVMGARVMPALNFDYGGARGVMDSTVKSFSVDGVLFRRRGAKMRSVGVAFPNLYKDEIDQKIQPLLETVGGSDFVFMCLDGASDTYRQSKMYFGLLAGDLTITWRTAKGYEWRVALQSVI